METGVKYLTIGIVGTANGLFACKKLSGEALVGVDYGWHMPIYGGKWFGSLVGKKVRGKTRAARCWLGGRAARGGN
jgi:membrane-associated PAP2 superfamily phosphatase